MRIVFGIFLGLLGSFLFALKIDNLGQIGNIFMKIIGILCFVGVIYIGKKRK